MSDPIEGPKVTEREKVACSENHLGLLSKKKEYTPKYHGETF